MTKRGKIGNRRYRADIEQHDGTETDDHGNPTYTTNGDWDTLVEGWPCEILTVSGDESTSGGQATASTTHVLYGSFSGGSQIEPDMRLNVDGVFYNVIAAYDPDGDRREIKVEAKRDIT